MCEKARLKFAMVNLSFEKLLRPGTCIYLSMDETGLRTKTGFGRLYYATVNVLFEKSPWHETSMLLSFDETGLGPKGVLELIWYLITVGKLL